MLTIDVNEPKQATVLLGQSVPIEVAALNANGWADYRWPRASGGYTNVERKTWPEILANVDAVEDQLRRHKKNQPGAKLVFVLEGWAVEAPDGTHTVVRANKGDGIWLRGHKSGTRLARIWSWLYAAAEFVEILQTGSYEQTCQLLVMAYKHDQKPEDDKNTFKRHYKEITFHPNPMVQRLMGIEPGIGEKRAEALITTFGSLWNVLSASSYELQAVPGIGPTIARNLLARVGRLDV